MTSESAFSRQMLARAFDASTPGDEDARAFLQNRLELYARVIVWAFIALRAFEVVLYATYPHVKPELYSAIFATGMVGLVAQAFVWRRLRSGQKLSITALARIDLVYTAFGGLVFGATALLAFDRHESAYTCLVYACFLVFARVLVVPSSGRFTLKASAIAFLPLVGAAAGLGAATDQEIPGAAYFACAFVYSAMAVTIATAGSNFIYGLRRHVRENARLGQYTLEHKIAEGGMGAVYRAQHSLLRRPTAVKLLHPDRIGASTLDRFEREVQHMSQLTHPNAVAVFDFGHDPDGVFYYAMEYLDGIDLEQLVRTHGPQPAARVIDIIVQVCGALHEAHLRGLVHRDVKPANIILCERGGQPDVAKVIDFGLARELAVDGAARSVVGTPAYLAPEAIVAPASVGPPADIYAVGAVAYFLLVGRCVFEADTPDDFYRMHVEEAPRAPGASEALDALVLACLAKDPARRPASTAALARELRALRPALGWDAAAAREWWQTFRGAARAPTAAAPSVVTIDLDARATR